MLLENEKEITRGGYMPPLNPAILLLSQFSFTQLSSEDFSDSGHG